MSGTAPGEQPLAGLGLIDHHCHSLRADWATAAADPRSAVSPGWRQCFTEASSQDVIDRDVPYLLGYRHFLTEINRMLGAYEHGVGAGSPSRSHEDEVIERRDRLAGEPYLRHLLDDASTTALLVDTGFGGPQALDIDELRRISGRDVREVVRLESVAEDVLSGGGPPGRSLSAFVDAVGARLAEALDSGAVAIKSILAYRTGLRMPDAGALAQRQAFARMNRRQQARRFDDPVLVPSLVRLAGELAAQRGVPLQFHTGFGDPDIDLPAADPALLRRLFRDPRTEACPVVLLHCYPYVRTASYLANTYPQVFMDLSLTLPLAEPVAATVVREALALCPATKLLAASDGHSYPEMHWWGAIVWRRALAEVLDAERKAEALDEPAATEVAGRILAGNAGRLYGLSTPREG